MSLRAKLGLWLALALLPAVVLCGGGALSPAGLLILALALLVLGLAIDWSYVRPLELARRQAADAEAPRVALASVQRQHAAAVREIHHRVKNNLQIVSSLLDLQVTRARSPELRAGLNATRSRVGTLALLHRHLYDDASFHSVDLRAFLGELCEQLRDGDPGDSRERVALSVEAAPIRVASDQAVALGLITTEAVGNALKHAFPGQRGGHVRVELAAEGETGCLRVADDGVGQPAAPAAGAGLGRVLMTGFAQQLGGKLSSNGDAGTEVTVRFKLRT